MCADSYYYSCNCALARANALRGMYIWQLFQLTLSDNVRDKTSR